MTVIPPGAVATELPNSASDPDAAERIGKFLCGDPGPADSFARAAACARGQPKEVAANEILFSPTRQEP